MFEWFWMRLRKRARVELSVSTVGGHEGKITAVFRSPEEAVDFLRKWHSSKAFQAEP